jgi:ribosomal protein S27AE
MLRLRECPRCQGDILLALDSYGWYEECIQCGYIRDLHNMGEISAAFENSGVPDDGPRSGASVTHVSSMIE